MGFTCLHSSGVLAWAVADPCRCIRSDLKRYFSLSVLYRMKILCTDFGPHFNPTCPFPSAMGSSSSSESSCKGSSTSCHHHDFTAIARLTGNVHLDACVVHVQLSNRDTVFPARHAHVRLHLLASPMSTANMYTRRQGCHGHCDSGNPCEASNCGTATSRQAQPSPPW